MANYSSKQGNTSRSKKLFSYKTLLVPILQRYLFNALIILLRLALCSKMMIIGASRSNEMMVAVYGLVFTNSERFIIKKR